MLKRISLSVLLWCCSSLLLWAQEDREGRFLHDCVERRYTIHLPPEFSPDSSYPMILLLHGFTQSGMDIRSYTEFDSLADREGIIMLYPEGISGKTPWGTNRHWNSLFHDEVDDIGFLNRLIDQVGAQYPVDLSRVYAVGFSNGGFMCFELACALSDRIAAIASVSGSMSFEQERHCFPDRPISVLAIHGTEDQSVFPLGTKDYLSNEDLIGFWRGKYDLSHESKQSLPDSDQQDQSQATLNRYSQPNSSTEFLYYQIQGGGHTWPNAAYDFPALGATNRDLQTNEVIWEFFQQHRHPAPRAVAPEPSEAPHSSPDIIWHIDPISEELSVKWLGGIPHWVRIYDMQGREVAAKPYPGLEWRLSLGLMPPGISLLRYKQKGRVMQEKIVLR